MSNVPKIVPQPIIVGFFLLGLLSSIAFRAILLLQKYEPRYVRPVWYFGVIGYMMFFIYRYYISQRRKRTIARSDLIEKIRAGVQLTPEDRAANLYLLTSIRKSQEDWNYFAIFILSLLAMALDWFLPGK